MVSNYAIGRNKEYRIKRKLEKELLLLKLVQRLFR